MIGQDRAAEAVRFGIGIKSDGHNVFVMGPSASGRHSMVMRRCLPSAPAPSLPAHGGYIPKSIEIFTASGVTPAI